MPGLILPKQFFWAFVMQNQGKWRIRRTEVQGLGLEEVLWWENLKKRGTWKEPEQCEATI